jgi:hypothetical protein
MLTINHSFKVLGLTVYSCFMASHVSSKSVFKFSGHLLIAYARANLLLVLELNWSNLEHEKLSTVLTGDIYFRKSYMESYPNKFPKE